MKIGLTYDLRSTYIEMGFSEEETAEFDSDETIAAIDDTISSLGHESVRIGNIYELTRCLSAGEQWDLVFNISEGLYGRNREAQVPALLEAYNIPYTFSDPLTLSLCLDKALAKRVARDAGIPTPDFLLINSPADLEDIGKLNPTFPLFVKPVSEGTGKGVSPESIVLDKEALKRQCMKLLIRYHQPVIVEQYLAGREFTAGILGTDRNARVIGVLEVTFLKNAEALFYSFNNKKLYEDRVTYTVVKDKNILKEASEIALMSYTALKCRDASRVDLKADKNGKLYFLEINPLAGLHPIHSDLIILCKKVGLSYSEIISEIIESARGRQISRTQGVSLHAKLSHL